MMPSKAFYLHKLNSEKNVVSLWKFAYSVWDFMNLLKYLQKSLTVLPLHRHRIQTKVTRLINEIVLEEENDAIDDQTTNHFHYYVTTY